MSPALAELLGQPAFVRFMFARVLAGAASQMLMVALGWHMYDLTCSAWDLGLVGLYQFVPALLVTLPAGLLADRVQRGRIFAVCMVVQAVVCAVLAWADLRGVASRELILVVSVLLGMARGFQMPAQQALVPLLVPQALLQRAIAVSTSGMQAAIIGGPALGGLLYAGGASVVYLSSGVLLAIAAVLSLASRHVQSQQASAAGWRSVMAGVAFVRSHRVLLGATTLDLFAVLLGGATALLPIYARDLLHTGPLGLGLLRAAPAVGALLMSFVLAHAPMVRKVGQRLLLAVAVFGLATVVFGLSRSFTLSLLALAATGAADNISVVTRLTLVQMETPDEMRGRVAAVNAIFIGASNQLGEFESGATAALLGAVGSVVAGGIGSVLVAAAWWRLFPELAARDRIA